MKRVARIIIIYDDDTLFIYEVKKKSSCEV